MTTTWGGTAEDLDEVFEQAVTPMLLLQPGASGPVVRAANQAASVLGQEPADLRGRRWQGLTHPGLGWFESAAEELLTHLGAERRERQVELVANGATVTVKLSRLRDRGTPTVLAQFHIGPAGPLAEAAVREAQVRQREADERLHALDRAKTEFIATVSHELRTPITNVLGYTEILCAGEVGTLPPPQAQVLERVRRNGQRLLTLVEDLLTVSNVESGKFHIDQCEVSLPGVVRRALGALETSLAGRQLSLSVTVATGEPTVVGDAVQIERAVINLVGNAVKFTPDGGEITVSVGQDDGHCVVRVTDTGVGIPLEEQAQVFDRFYRCAHAHQRAIPGTGLGLSIVRSVVSSHGGTMGLTSEPGHGTTVEMRFPSAPDPSVRLTDSPAGQPVANLVFGA